MRSHEEPKRPSDVVSVQNAVSRTNLSTASLLWETRLSTLSSEPYGYGDDDDNDDDDADDTQSGQM